MNTFSFWRSNALLQAGICCTLLLVGGCAWTSAPPGEPDGNPTGRNPSDGIVSIVNRETGELSTSIRSYMYTEYDEMRLAEVVRSLELECIQRRGVGEEIDAPKEPDPLYGVSVLMPPFTIEQAEMYASFHPMPMGDFFGNGIIPETVSDEYLDERDVRVREYDEQYKITRQVVGTPDYEKAAKACAGDPEIEEWKSFYGSSFVGPWNDEFVADVDEALADKRVARIKTEFDACVHENGLDPVEDQTVEYDSLFRVEGQALEAIDEQQVRLAIEVVRCKDQVQASERTIEIVSEYQSETYLQYADELDKNRLRLDELRRDLDEWWATRG